MPALARCQTSLSQYLPYLRLRATAGVAVAKQTAVALSNCEAARIPATRTFSGELTTGTAQAVSPGDFDRTHAEPPCNSASATSPCSNGCRSAGYATHLPIIKMFGPVSQPRELVPLHGVPDRCGFDVAVEATHCLRRSRRAPEIATTIPVGIIGTTPASLLSQRV